MLRIAHYLTSRISVNGSVDYAITADAGREPAFSNPIVSGTVGLTLIVNSWLIVNPAVGLYADPRRIDERLYVLTVGRQVRATHSLPLVQVPLTDRWTLELDFDWQRRRNRENVVETLVGASFIL